MEVENDNDLIGCTDAHTWAERFVEQVRRQPSIAGDIGAMTAWFAGALGSQQIHDDSAAVEARIENPPRCSSCGCAAHGFAQVEVLIYGQRVQLPLCERCGPALVGNIERHVSVGPG